MSRLQSFKVLIVDDDADIRDVIRTKLELHGAICEEAEDGLIAFDKIKKNKFDCVISDVRMPNASGIDLLKMIREYYGVAPRIIMMSAFTDLTQESARSLGAYGLFMKPDDLEKLILMIEDSL